MDRQDFIDLLLQLGFVESNLTGNTWPKFMSIGHFESCRPVNPLQQLVNFWKLNNGYILIEHPTPFLIPEGITFHLWENGVKEYLVNKRIYSESVTLQVRQPPQTHILLYNTQFTLYKISLAKEYPKDDNWENIYSYVEDFKSLSKTMIKSRLDNVEYVDVHLLVELKEDEQITKSHNKLMSKLKNQIN